MRFPNFPLLSTAAMLSLAVSVAGFFALAAAQGLYQCPGKTVSSPQYCGTMSDAREKQEQTKVAPLIGGAIGGWTTESNDEAAVGKAKPGAPSMRAVPVAQLKQQQKSSLPAAPSRSLSAPTGRSIPVIEGGGSLKQPCGMGHLGCLDGDPPSGKGFNPKK